jgi:hypothetical protein
VDGGRSTVVLPYGEREEKKIHEGLLGDVSLAWVGIRRHRSALRVPVTPHTGRSRSGYGNERTDQSRLRFGLLLSSVLLTLGAMLGCVNAVVLRSTLDAREYPGTFGLQVLPWLIAAIVVPAAAAVLATMVFRSRAIEGRRVKSFRRWGLVFGLISILVCLLGMGWVIAVQFSLPNNTPSWALGGPWPPSWYRDTDNGYLPYAAALATDLVAVVAMAVGFAGQGRRGRMTD